MKEGKLLQVLRYSLPIGLDCYDTIKAIINDINSYSGPDLKSTIDLILKKGELRIDPHVTDYKDAQEFLIHYSDMLEIKCENCTHHKSFYREEIFEHFQFCGLENEELAIELSKNENAFFTDKIENCGKEKQCEDFLNKELPKDALPISEIVKQLL